MRNVAFALVLLAPVAILGCVALSPESQAKVDELSAQNELLAMELEDIVAKANSGEISLADAIEGVKKIKAAIEDNKKQIEEISKAEGLSTRDGILVAIGVFARSILHVGSKAIPTNWGWLAGILNLLLGGSENKKKLIAKK